MASPIAAETSVGAVRLTVADLEPARSFYERVLGLRPLERTDGVERLGVPGRSLVELVERPGAPPARRRSTGLFHLALLVPSRVELARAVDRVLAAGWPLTGASDHLVSEAVYLDDPEGNGIEIYRDRPPEQWEHTSEGLRMATLPLDLDGVLAERPRGPEGAGAPPATVVGHVHLRVDDLTAAERFYHGILGLDVTVRAYPGALFLSAGGYHHHVAVNTWSGPAGPPDPGSRGLDYFELVVPDRASLEGLDARLEDAGLAGEPDGTDLPVRDPAGNRVLLREQRP